MKSGCSTWTHGITCLEPATVVGPPDWAVVISFAQQIRFGVLIWPIESVQVDRWRPHIWSLRDHVSRSTTELRHKKTVAENADVRT